MVDWDKRFMDLAHHVAGWSKDRSTKVGAVIVDPKSKAVVSMGYNGFVRGADDTVEARHERPLKYKWTAHGEANAIHNAERSVRGCTLYTQFYPCTNCAMAIIQAGITRVVTVLPDWNHPRWGEDFQITREMFSEVGLAVDFVEQ